MTPAQIKRAHALRMNAVNELRALDAAVEGEFSVEDTAKEASINEEMRRLDTLIANGLDSIEGAAKQAEAVAALEERSGTPTAAPSDESARLRAFAHGESRSIDFMPSNFEERAAMQKGTDSEGGYTVPVNMYDNIVKSLRDLSSVMEAGATVISTAGGEDITVPKSLAFPTAAIVAEEGTFGGSDSTFGVTTLGAYKYGFLSTASVELLQDSAFNVEAYIASVGAEALSHAMNTHFITGTGTGQAEGVATTGAGVTTGDTLTTKGVLTSDQLIDFAYSLQRQYRPAASWLVSDAFVLAARKLKDGNGQYLWQPGMTASQPDMLVGSPVFTDAAVPALAATVNITQAIYGDLKRAYMVRLAGGINITRSDEYAFASDQVTWKFSLRADGRIVDTSAARKLINPAA